MREASGARAGVPEDAAAGLTTTTDQAGNLWAWAPEGQWMRIHAVRGGDSLWNLSGRYYGAPSLAGVHAIHDVPENRAIQGSDPNTGLIPGDRILIPNLPQPAGAPVANVPSGGGSPSGATTTDTGGNATTTDDSAPSDVEQNLDDRTVVNGGGGSPSGGELLNVAEREGKATPTPGEGVSTGTKVALVAAGLAGLAFVGWLLARKPKRRTRRAA